MTERSTNEIALPSTSKGKATREKLLHAAAEVFGQLGYETTRIADINNLAGVSHGLFYRHFKDKGEILLAVLEQMNAQLRHASGRETRHDNGVTLVALERRNTDFFHEYAQNRTLLRVAREVAARNDAAEFREVWLNIRNLYVERTHRWLLLLENRGDIAAIPDARMVAVGLAALTEQVAYIEIGLSAETPDQFQIERLGKACALIWFRTICGTST